MSLDISWKLKQNTANQVKGKTHHWQYKGRPEESGPTRAPDSAQGVSSKKVLRTTARSSRVNITPISCVMLSIGYFTPTESLVKTQ